MIRVIGAITVVAMDGTWKWIGDNSQALGVVLQGLVLAVALLAAFFTFGQVREAARLRKEQAQPYVAADMRQHAPGSHIIEVFFRNYGPTAAHNVRVTCDPPLRSSWRANDPEGAEVRLFDVLPTMAPGQEWATLWDTGMGHTEEFGKATDVMVSFESSNGDKHSHVYRLDWAAHEAREFVSGKGLDEAAKALEKIARAVANWQKSGAIVVQSKADHREEAAARQAMWEEHRAADQAEAEQSTPA